MTESRESTLRLTFSQAPAAGTDPGEPVTVMTVRGHLDLDSAGRLRTALDGLLTSSSCRIVLELGGLEFCDSVGLSALVDAHRACESRGGYVRLAAPSPFLSRVLGVVGLLGRIPVYDSVPAAVADDPPGGRPRPVDDSPTR